MYQTQSPVLFLVFNRPSTTKLVFEEIRKAKPKRIYIAADGARNDNLSDIEKCKEVKEIVSLIDWECDVKTLYRNENLGCKYAVSSAIDWFFENEPAGIVLEDDCLPNNDFFRFCDEMLSYYNDDERVRFIAGSNFQNGVSRSDGSYYFSKLSHVWGWASWRRAWKDYDVELDKYRGIDGYKAFYNVFKDSLLAEDWASFLKQLHNNEINTWDYQWAITNMFNNGLSVMPNVNLISNIGFGDDATHTFADNGFQSLATCQLEDKIIHPTLILPNTEADYYTLQREHHLEGRLKRIKKKNRFKKFKFWKK
jgi:hypothetical protein